MTHYLKVLERNVNSLLFNIFELTPLLNFLKHSFCLIPDYSYFLIGVQDILGIARPKTKRRQQ